jgi:hypothetical protein
MKSEILKEEEREYPCLVVEDQMGDGSKPTVYLKPDKFKSIVVVVGYFAMQMEYELGHVIDANDPAVQSERSLDDGKGIDENLPLFRGRLTLEN